MANPRSKEDIANYFNHYGTISEVVNINKNREFSGAALVTFTSLTEADEAIERLRNTTIPGANAPVNMKWSDTEEHRLGLLQHDDHTLYIKSLPRKANTVRIKCYAGKSQIGIYAAGRNRPDSHGGDQVPRLREVHQEGVRAVGDSIVGRSNFSAW